MALSQLEVVVNDVAIAAPHRRTIRKGGGPVGSERLVWSAVAESAAVIRRRFSHQFLFRAVSHKS